MSKPYSQPGENPTDTNQASEVKRNSLNKSDEDVKLEPMTDLEEAIEKLKIALFIRTLILIWVVMAGTIFVLWVGGELK